MGLHPCIFIPDAGLGLKHCFSVRLTGLQATAASHALGQLTVFVSQDYTVLWGKEAKTYFYHVSSSCLL